jgi:hypothetical protein
MARAAAIAILFAVTAAFAAGQARNAAGADRAARSTGAVDESSPWLAFDDPGEFDALLTWFPPYFIQAGIALKDFIRSGEFAAWREYAGDARAVDAIYVRAMALTANNTSLALLAATVATFDHYVVGLDVPVLSLVFPLSNESREDFAARVRNLPSDFYPDTPPGSHGDRDKLQHFFGAAYIAMTFESRGAAQRVGDFVEAGEEAVIIDGVLDSRDERANWNGTEFGIALLANNRRYPSEFFRAPIVGGPGAGGRNDAGAPTVAGHGPTGPQTGCR